MSFFVVCATNNNRKQNKKCDVKCKKCHIQAPGGWESNNYELKWNVILGGLLYLIAAPSFWVSIAFAFTYSPWWLMATVGGISIAMIGGWLMNKGEHRKMEQAGFELVEDPNDFHELPRYHWERQHIGKAKRRAEG